MTSDRPNGGTGGGQPDEKLSRVQRLMLYFTTPLRRTMAVLVVVGGWMALNVLRVTYAGESLLLGMLTMLLFYPSVFVLAVLLTQGSFLRRPVRLPIDVMRRTAARRFSLEESWSATQGISETLSALHAVFTRPGASSREIGTTLWVELDRDWDTTGLRHQAAVLHLKRPAPLHFFVEDSSGETTVTAFSSETRPSAVWDVFRLADEMAAAAVQLARAATSQDPDSHPGPGSVSSRR
ncbi:hypothetical protein I6N91_13240 [Arthrobacter sp. MSA 4-2]|uniref:hypothetical protein n=1 Tax=Arthrobacter sp. MSA 4-2 TaxID=2794349 RepID=UPI0018E779F1|nr:hypothetical protein [Arthrobacter sp. MSA 4-2]MBJ2121945.1 hypothetical protein [Arthrobacter sp. MSA 4-2]